MNQDQWRQKIVVGSDEELKHEGSRTKGFMEETDIDTYSIVRADGTKTGSVTVSDHTAVRGFRRTVRVTQTDAAGKVIVEESYTVN